MTTPTPASVPRRSVVAVYLAFALNGGAFASFASRIPDIKANLGLQPAQLGLLLLCISAGSVLALPLSGWVAGRLGAARAVRVGVGLASTGYAVAALAVSLFSSAPLAGVGMFCAGAGVGIWDVSMNLEGAAVEQRLGRAIMPRFHAGFSLGTVLAALLGAAVTGLHIPVGVHLVVMMVLILVLTNVSVQWFGSADAAGAARAETDAAAAAAAEAEVDTHAHPGSAPGSTPPKRRGSHLVAWTERRNLLIGAVVLVAAFTEGTANDWVSVGFVDGHHVPSWAGVLAFAAFLTSMTVGRVVGTKLLDRYGRVPVVRLTFAAAVVGCVMVVFGPLGVAYAGTLVWGFGASLGFPVGMSAAADDPRRAAARVSVVATIGYGAFLIGPPLLGFLGQHVGVLKALLAVGVAVALGLFAVPAVRKPAET